MSRTLHANIVATLNDAFLQPVQFVELRFDSGTVYVHDDLGTITWGAHDWIGTGRLGSVGEIEESDGITPAAIEISVSGVDAALLSEARTQNYQDRAIIVYIGMRDVVTAAMVSDPAEVFYGYMDQMRIITGKGSAAISIVVESEQIRWQRAPLKYYDDATLQTDYAGDLFFKFLKDMGNLQLRWGNDYAVNLGDKG